MSVFQFFSFFGQTILKNLGLGGIGRTNVAWPGPGHGLAMAWQGHGQVALGAKPVAQDGVGPGNLGTPGPWGPGTLGTPEPRAAPLASSQAPLGHGIARPWPGHDQVLARPDQATYF